MRFRSHVFYGVYTAGPGSSYLERVESLHSAGGVIELGVSATSLAETSLVQYHRLHRLYRVFITSTRSYFILPMKPSSNSLNMDNGSMLKGIRYSVSSIKTLHLIVTQIAVYINGYFHSLVLLPILAFVSPFEMYGPHCRIPLSV